MRQYMRKIVGLSCTVITLLMVSSVALAQFKVDLSREEIMRLDHDFLLKDLVMGDSMRVARWAFCLEGDNLMLSGLTGNADKTTYWPEFLVVVKPQQRVVLTVTPVDSSTLDEMLPTMTRCEDVNEMGPFQRRMGADKFYVDEINGHKSLSSYVRSLVTSGMK